MDGRKSETPDRREPVLARVVVNPTPGKLRDSLERVDSMLPSVEEEVRRRVRLLLGEIIGRSSDPGVEPTASIQIDVAILPRAIRIEVSGDGLQMPGPPTGGGRSGYPHWILHGLADRWGSNRRMDGGMWFLLERPDR